MKLRILAITSLVLLVAGPVAAHGGHASGSLSTFSHLVSDPFHLSLIGLAAIAAYCASRVVRQVVRQKVR